MQKRISIELLVLFRRTYKALNYHERITNLSIIYLANKLGTYESHIKQSDFEKLSTAFVEAGIKTDLLFHSEMDLNTQQNFNLYATKNSYLLIVDPVEVTMHQGSIINIIHHLYLYDVKKKQKIWTAKIWLDNWVKSVFRRYDEIGQSIVNKLREEKLIR